MSFYSIILFIIFICISVGLIIAQVYLSRTKSPYPGLVLPALLLLIVLLPAVFSFARYITLEAESPKVESQTEVSEGIWCAVPRQTENYNTSGFTSIIFVLYAFIMDIVLFVIYFNERRKIVPDKKAELKRMAVQDL